MTEGALVLEGGSLRSVFTAGVLDVFLDNQIEFSYVNGVSAGAMCGINYISKQPGRTMMINHEYLNDKRYVSLKSLVKNRLVFNFDFLFGEVSESLIPLDYQTFAHSQQRFVVVATRCKTGKPEFFEKGQCEDILLAARASASMPMLSKMVSVAGKKYLDGGISLPISYQQALDEGYKKVVLVLTREQGYQKPPVNHWYQKAYGRYFAPLPEIQKAMDAVPERYNQMQQEIDDLVSQGRVFVIRPEYPVLVSRLERDRSKITTLYEEGKRVGLANLTQLKKYLEI